MKELFVLRHAKSSWDDPELRDHDRPLTPRGIKSAKLIARYMKEKEIAPSIVLCTSAVRAQQTLDLIAPSLPGGTEIKIEPRLYGATGNELLTRMRRLSQGAPSVLMIGHNPSLQDLVVTLSRGGPQTDAVERKFPTAALAVLQIPIEEWRDLRPAGATLIEFITPRSLS